ncbi:MAG: plasmid pRiA4b ORF-3 family protein [Prevotellaceae bacterium]|jgi:hypothetical protein|nr:plasmid pRiA4b ORF-3 family protein [Prevotellaceae bacterium]
MIYSFILKINNCRSFIREYHVPSEYSLYDFKRFIVSELDFDDSQQSVFFLLNGDGEKMESYSLFDTGNGAMDTVTLEDLNSRGMEKLLYTFDFFNNRSLSIEFLGETERQPRVSYPAVAQSKGDAPGQFFEKLDDDIEAKMSDTVIDEEDYDYDEDNEE